MLNGIRPQELSESRQYNDNAGEIIVRHGPHAVDDDGLNAHLANLVNAHTAVLGGPDGVPHDIHHLSAGQFVENPVA